MILPTDVQEEIARGEAAYKTRHRFDAACGGDFNHKILRSMTRKQKLQHFYDSIFNALGEAAKDGRGQPPMVARFRAAAIIVDSLESSGVPFGVCTNSRMNKMLLKKLNERVEHSADDRKSRRKKITAGAVRSLLKNIKRLRLTGDHFIQLPPYDD